MELFDLKVVVVFGGRAKLVRLTAFVRAGHRRLQTGKTTVATENAKKKLRTLALALVISTS